MLGGQVDSGGLDALTGEDDRVMTRPGAKIDQGAASLVPEALKEAIPEVGAALTEAPLLALRSLGVVEGNKSLFERWMGGNSSRNLDALIGRGRVLDQAPRCRYVRVGEASVIARDQSDLGRLAKS